MKSFLFAISALLFSMCSAAPEPEAPLDAEDIKPLLISQQVPDVTLQNLNGEDVNLPELVSEKPTLIVFYRGGWCPFCSAQLSSLSAIEDELYNLGVQIIGISPDKPEYLSESVVEYKLGYQLLSDNRMEAAREFGIAFKLAESVVLSYKDRGLDLEERSGHTHHLLPVPSVFLMNTDGKIYFQYVNPDFRTRISGGIILAAARDLVES